tara:strand:- start:1215 stop:1316 length:102 start_codon:yes stop_codon:yes gene_type:complete
MDLELLKFLKNQTNQMFQRTLKNQTYQKCLPVL